MPTPYTVLFLCTGNSARSILSEALLNDIGEGRFKAHSAGSKPSGAPHPDALALLQVRGHATDGLASKSWDGFAADDAPDLDLVVTVCASAAGETCPVFRGEAMTVHWPAPDPAHIPDRAAREQAFRDVYRLSRSRIEALVRLSDEELRDHARIQRIGKVGMPPD